jgi:tRNA uridine 5-carboxymethylaminomethyl modification enzyme
MPDRFSVATRRYNVARFRMNTRIFEVLVIGGGHAGVEAAWAAANLLPGPGTVALVTIDPTKIGVMSCNPAIGGLAKGQLVREVDALGGLMGLATDATGIQFKMLNTSKGPAVHGPRAQCDKHAYAEAVQMLVASREEIEIVAGTVDSLVVEAGRCTGTIITSPTQGPITIRARAVVLTTGTFMRGLMHTGESKTAGGRHGEAAAHRISDSLRDLGFELGRLKTGTPPRLMRDSIDWHGLGEQLPDEAPIPFSDLTDATHPQPHLATSDACKTWWSRGWDETGVSAAHQRLHSWREAGFIQRAFPLLPQVSCRTTQTSAAAHDAIRANVHRAPMYNGQIESAGPRYCPSIEDKVMRFADRESHGVFLEPESLRSDWVYCNGISSSLPADVQDTIVRGMPGCERAVIHRYGYAVEYDMVRPHQIHVTGHSKLVHGLFLAGQINGTSGYEEAAAQGLVAGVNAARLARDEAAFVLGRDEAYIGVLMDDLVTKTPVEPYRMFTSRAEHRLLLRADNAPERLTQRAIDVGLLSHTPLGRARRAMFERRSEQSRQLQALVNATSLQGQPLEKLLRGQAFELEEFKAAMPGMMFDESVWRTVHAERRYAAYIVRQQAEVKRHAEMEHKRLPESVDYLAITHLRPEARQALHRFRPSTFGQAARLEGITPADITLLSVLLGKR